MSLLSSIPLVGVGFIPQLHCHLLLICMWLAQNGSNKGLGTDAKVSKLHPFYFFNLVCIIYDALESMGKLENRVWRT